MADDSQLAAVLSDFARTMLTDFPIQRILDHLVLRIVDILPITAAGVTLISPVAGPRYVAASDDSALRYEELQSELGEGPCLAAYLSGEAVSIANLSQETRFKVFVPRALAAGLAAAFTFPLHHGDSQLGALDLYRDQVGKLSRADLVTAQTLADVAAAYLVNAQARAELQEASERFHERSVHDALTGLPNRTLLLERLEHAALRGRRSTKLLGLLFVDLDHFKTINDDHGHQVGDALLIAVGERMMAQLRPGDTLARLCGDEFVVLCEELDGHNEAAAVAQRILEVLAIPFDLSGIEIQVTASVGIALAGPGEHVPDQLLRDADMAMYQAKRHGGSDYRVVDLRQQQLTTRRTSLESDLVWAVSRRELRLDYQKIVRTIDGQASGAEALLRWDHPTRGPVPPMTLIPLAEQSGLILLVGRWVLERACIDRHRWGSPGRGNGALGVVVNVSAHQLMARDFAATVSAVLAETNTIPELLTLDISESVFLHDPDRALVVLHQLKRCGVHVALDDFGSGYSSLANLKRFPVDAVKIDPSFIADLKRDRASRAIVSAVVDLAHELRVDVVAEGVETVEQRDEVAKLGGDSCQGYYFGRPTTADHLAEATA